MLADFLRDGSPGDMPTAGAGPGMALIFTDLCYQGWQFCYLMPGRFRITCRCLFRKRGLASIALLRQERDDFLNAIGRNKCFEMRRMTFLTSPPSSTPLLYYRWGSIGRIGRRRNGGVGRVGFQPGKQIPYQSFQLGYTTFQLSNPDIPLTTSRTFRFIHDAIL